MNKLSFIHCQLMHPVKPGQCACGRKGPDVYKCKKPLTHDDYREFLYQLFPGADIIADKFVEELKGESNGEPSATVHFIANRTGRNL